MGLRSKSTSLPKLPVNNAIEKQITKEYWKVDCNGMTEFNGLITKSKLCQLDSDKQSQAENSSNEEENGNGNVSNERGTGNVTPQRGFRNVSKENGLGNVITENECENVVKENGFGNAAKENGIENLSKAHSKNTTRGKQNHESKNGISRRLRGIFQSLFHLDKRDKENFHNLADFSTIEHKTQSKSRSLPDLYRTGKSPRKPLISNFLRKSRRRISSFRERNRSLTSFYGVTSNESLQDVGQIASKYSKSNGFNDFSAPNSPLSSENRPVFSSSLETSPVFLQKKKSFSPEDTAKNGNAKLRRERFRRSKTTDFSKRRHNGERFASFSESSDVTEEGDSIDMCDVITSSASVAVQNRRKLPKNKRGQVTDGSPIAENSHIRRNGDNLGVEREKGVDKDKRVIMLSQLADCELNAFLRNKNFDPQKSKDWCSDIGELMRDKIQTETKGDFKVIVQVFIGAIEDDGIRTAMQCNLNPNCDEFVVASFRNDSLFAFASLFVVDVRER